MHKPIPDSVWKLVRGLENHAAVRRAVETVQKDGDALKFTVEHDADGFMLICFYQDDLWMLQHPSGEWQQCYVGHDKDFSNEVLEEKYGLRRIFDAYLGIFGERLPIYI